MSPTRGKSGIRSSALHAKLYAWGKVNGYLVFGSNTGFVFGDQPVRKVSPDEVLIKKSRFDELSENDQEKLVPIAPDVAVELISKSQEYGKKRVDVTLKGQAMFGNELQFVVMLDPYTEKKSDRIVTWGMALPSFPTVWDDVLDA